MLQLVYWLVGMQSHAITGGEDDEQRTVEEATVWAAVQQSAGVSGSVNLSV